MYDLCDFFLKDNKIKDAFSQREMGLLLAMLLKVNFCEINQWS